MKIRNFLKKTLAVVLTFAMLAPIMGNLQANVKEVKAEETSSNDSLNVKCQVTQGVVTKTNIDKYRGNYVIRFVSAVKDYTAYDEIGFKVLEEGQTVPKRALVKTVFKRIESTTGSTATERETYTYSPKVVNTDAEYFITAKLPVAPANTAVKYTVWAYGIKDGVEVTGPERCVSVNDGLEETPTINMSFPNTNKVDLTVGTKLKANALDAEVIGLSQDNSTVHVRINKPASLLSATLFELKTEGGQSIGKEVLRNLNTKYTGTADTSWYEEYLKADSTETKFTIVTSEDLYGLAKLTNTGNENNVKQDFAGKQVYLVSDIAVNDDTLITDSTAGNKYKQWRSYNETSGEYEYSAQPTYSWTPIGRGMAFKGTFDAQMHTISGIYCSDGQENSGLFALIQGATIQNLKLTNSYVNGTQIRTGSIVARMNGGTLNTIYSDVLVDSTSYYVGGLVGLCGYANIISNCWFNGSIKNTCTSQAPQTGGILGITYGSSSLQITNCLNSGTIDVSASTKENLQTGGIVGYNVATPTTITECLNTGTIKTNSENNYAGIIVGEINNNTKSTVNCIRSYGYGASRVVGNMATTNDKIVGTFTITYVSGGTTFENVKRSSSAAAYQSVPIISMRNDENKFLGTGAQTNLEGLDFDNTWSVVAGSTPVLACLKTTLIDDSWYDEDVDTYVLYDKADLYGFATLSQTEDFAGKTVKLGNDIEVNTGDYTTWSPTNAPKHKWTAIGYKTSSTYNAFQGTFDGQGHTISGLYMYTANRYAGLFAAVGENGIVQNVKLTDSYLQSTHRELGGIAGFGAGKFYMIYNSATVVGEKQAVGGIVGQANGTKVVLENCWFDGSVTNTGNANGLRGTGGLVGVAYREAEGELKLRNCLNTGIVDASEYAYDQDSGTNEDGTEKVNITSCVGGLIGQIDPKTNVLSVEINACLSAGDVRYNEFTTGGCGSIVGYNSYKDSVYVSATYATEESLKSNISSASYKVVDADTIKGSDAQNNMDLLGWGTDWQCVNGDFPEIIFSDSGFGEDYVVTEDDAEAKLLSGVYANRSLYQGELHDHADNGRTSDGDVDLTTWASQMSDLNLDFAASLDHRMVTHIDDTTKWKKNLVVYGTEASTNIPGITVGKPVEVHYNMLFKDKDSLVKVLQQFDDFNYGNAKTYPLYAPFTYGDFDYADFTREDFKKLIQAVKDENGFFVLPHPVQNDNYTGDISDYYFENTGGEPLQYGFEVIYKAYNHASTGHNYNAWTQLLSEGARLWACAGTDDHGNLSNKALTSVYADATAESDKGNIIPYLSQGNFTAGSVGIQMCIGDTSTGVAAQMGGQCNFVDDQKLVVGIGKFHNSVVVSGNKYRVDILSGNDVVYSQKVVAGTDMTYIAMDVDTDSQFYRVEVFNATTGERIAIGNPIWNDK